METIQAEDLYYKPSGGFTVSGVLLCLIVTLPLAVVFGVLVTYAALYAHHPALSIFFDMVFALGLGWTFKKLIRIGKLRNSTITVLLSFTAAVFMIYTSWCTWAVLFRGQPLTIASLDNFAYPFEVDLFLHYAQHPLQLWYAITEGVSKAVYNLLPGSGMISRVLIYSCWFLELLWVWSLMMIPARAQATAIFSESADTWAEVYESPTFEFIADADGMKQALDRGQYSVLNNLRLTSLSPKEHSHAKLWLHYLPHSYDFYLTLRNTQVNKIDNAKLEAAFKYSHFKIVDKLRISAGTGQRLLDLMMKRPTL